MQIDSGEVTIPYWLFAWLCRECDHASMLLATELQNQQIDVESNEAIAVACRQMKWLVPIANGVHRTIARNRCVVEEGEDE